jgi:hypothetical protein
MLPYSLKNVDERRAACISSPAQTDVRTAHPAGLSDDADSVQDKLGGGMRR